MPYETYEELVSEAGKWTPSPQGGKFYNPLTHEYDVTQQTRDLLNARY